MSNFVHGLDFDVFVLWFDAWNRQLVCSQFFRMSAWVSKFRRVCQQGFTHRLWQSNCTMLILPAPSSEFKNLSELGFPGYLKMVNGGGGDRYFSQKWEKIWNLQPGIFDLSYVIVFCPPCLFKGTPQQKSCFLGVLFIALLEFFRRVWRRAHAIARLNRTPQMMDDAACFQ